MSSWPDRHFSLIGKFESGFEIPAAGDRKRSHRMGHASVVLAGKIPKHRLKFLFRYRLMLAYFEFLKREIQLVRIDLVRKIIMRKIHNLSSGCFLTNDIWSPKKDGIDGNPSRVCHARVCHARRCCSNPSGHPYQAS
jgi:hypothetical protein